jgi:hypothetical protein
MKIEVENLKAFVKSMDLTIHQKADAVIEFNKLLDHVDDLQKKNAELKKLLHSASLAFQAHPDFPGNIDFEDQVAILKELLSQK